MDQKLTEQLVNARNSLRKKLQSLKSDVEQSRQFLDHSYTPITDPLKDIAGKLQEVAGKFENIATVKSEPADVSKVKIKPQRKSDVGSQKRKSTFERRLTAHRDDLHATSTPVSSRIKSTPRFVKMESLSKSGYKDIERERHEAEVRGTPTLYQAEEDYSTDDSIEDAQFLLEKTRHELEEQIDSPVVKTVLEKFHSLPREYLTEYKLDIEGKSFDKKYGVREENDNMYVGAKRIQFEGPNIVIDGFTYKGTVGLYELLFKKTPGRFTRDDVRNYTDILRRTNAFRQQYDASLGIAANKSHKYMNIVQPILKGQPPKVWWAERWRTASIGPLKKTGGRIVHKEAIPGAVSQYQYWDDPNELIDRLRLLMASQASGHTGHKNEIISIIEELREAKIIK